MNTSTQENEAKKKAKNAANQGQEVAGHAAANAKDVAGSAQAGAQQVAGEARAQAGQLANQATDQIRNVTSDATNQLREHASTQTQRAAQGVRSFSEQATAVAEGRVDEAGMAGRYAQQAAGKLSELATRLEEGGIDGVMNDVATLARRRPGTFLIGASLVGFGLGRLARGAQVAHQNQDNDQATTGPGFAARKPIASDLDLTNPDPLLTEGTYSPRPGGY